MKSYDRTLTHAGLIFGVETRHDDCMGPPWVEHDGHGPVRELRGESCYSRRPGCKRPGERFLWWDRCAGLAYDIQQAQCIALADGWGISDAREAAMRVRLGREPTRREIAAAAVESDFEHCRAWAQGEWFFVTIRVVLLDVNGNETGEDEYLGGVEDFADEYILDVAAELAGEIADRIGDADELVTRRRIREEVAA